MEPQPNHDSDDEFDSAAFNRLVLEKPSQIQGPCMRRQKPNKIQTAAQFPRHTDHTTHLTRHEMEIVLEYLGEGIRLAVNGNDWDFVPWDRVLIPRTLLLPIQNPIYFRNYGCDDYDYNDYDSEIIGGFWDDVGGQPTYIEYDRSGEEYGW